MPGNETIEVDGVQYPAEKIKEWNVVSKKTGKGFTMGLFKVTLSNGETRLIRRVIKKQ